jgi:Pput_2613-like deaminase
MRRLAKQDADAANKLLDRYYRMSNDELLLRQSWGDETAHAVLNQKYDENFIRNVLGDNYRPPHEATATRYRSGEAAPVWQGKLKSGNPTAEEAALGWPESMLVTHTEPRAIRAAQVEGPLRDGDVLKILGEYDPCPSCHRRMWAAAKETGASIEYTWSGGTWHYERGRRFLVPR